MNTPKRTHILPEFLSLLRHALTAVAAVLLIGGLVSRAPAIDIGPTGSSGVNSFTATPVVTDWSTMYPWSGAAGDVTTAAGLDAAVAALTASAVNTAINTSGTTPPATGTRAIRNTSANYLQLRPATACKGVVAMATLKNTSGADITQLTITYDYQNINNAAEEVEGVRAYYSMTGLANSWTVIPALCTATTTTGLTTTIMLSSIWAWNSTMYVLWADDNGAAGNDANIIDNISFTINQYTPAAELLSFNWGTFVGVIDKNLQTGTLHISSGTNLNLLDPNPTFTMSYGATCDKTSGGSPGLYDFSTSQTYTITGQGGSPQKAFAVTVLADLPNVTLGLANSPLVEAGGVATVTATLSAATSRDVTVNLAFTGTATVTTDYLRSGTSITIPAGQTSGSITLTGVADTLYEYPDETIIVTISSVVNGLVGTPSAVTATITDTPAADFLTFTWGSYNGVIDKTAQTVKLYIPHTATVNPLDPNPSFTLTNGAICDKTSGGTPGIYDFSTPVQYTITPSAGTPKIYTVTVYPVLAAAGEILAIPADLPVGAQYRLVFVTSTETYGWKSPSGAPQNIADYNTFATNTATAVPKLAGLGTTWKAVVSTYNPTVNAKTNTGTDPTANGTGVPIYNLRGLRVADTNADMWDGTIQNPINWTELGAGPALQYNNQYIVWTGMYGKDNVADLGNSGADWSLVTPSGGYIIVGDATATDKSWASTLGTGDPNARKSDLQPIYVMSGVLTVPEPLSPLCDLVTFSWGAYNGTIDQGTKTATLHVPYGTNLNPLDPNPTYGISLGATCTSPNGGTPGSINFTTAQAYTVNAADGIHAKGYSVTVLADIPTVTLGISTTTFSEDSGTAIVTATLTNAVTQDVTVSLAFTGTAVLGTEYTASATSITIPANQLSASITLTGVQDYLYGHDMTVVVGIASTSYGLVGTPSSVSATITNTTTQPTGLPLPTGVNPATGVAWVPGDIYHLAFVTSTTHTASDPNIATYNTFVNAVAATSTLTDINHIEWRVIGSAQNQAATQPANVNAPVSGPVYLVDGTTLVATGYADIWDGSIAHGIDMDQNGATVAANTQVWTGTTNINGTPSNFSTGGPYYRSFGSTVGYCQLGLASSTDSQWITSAEGGFGGVHCFYALSVPLAYAGSGAMSYATWALINAGGQSAELDSNHNGIPNGVEYFMGATAANPGTMPAVVNTGGVLTWTWPYGPNAAVTYKFQLSDDLVNWPTEIAPPDASILVTPPVPPATLGTVKFTLPGGATQKFCRLVVTPN